MAQLEPGLVNEPAARGLIAGECIALAPAAVQRKHEQRRQALAPERSAHARIASELEQLLACVQSSSAARRSFASLRTSSPTYGSYS